MKRTLLIWAVVLTGGAAGAQQPATPYDVVILGGSVVDGTGSARFRADVATRGDRIVRVDRGGLVATSGREVVRADGLIVAPGFVDQHAHIQTSIHAHPLAENFTRQGITTILASLHSGDQPYPLADYMASLKVAPNVGFYSGHSWVRTKVIGLENRAPTAADLEQMRGLVDEAMKDGALGLSTGLLYVPANYATIEEVIELAKVAARYGGIYVSHMRDEADGLLDSVAETIRVGREARLPVQIQHHKAVGKPQWGWSRKTLAMIDAARAEGLDVTLDMYPYTASSTGSSVLFPQWALAGGQEEFAARIKDPATRARIEADMRAIFEKERGGDDLSTIQIRTLPSDRRYDGKTLADLARDRGLPNTAGSGIQLVIELQLKGGFSAIYHSMQEEDVVRIMKHPLTMFDTDGDPVGFGMGHPHPRSYGTFPRVLGRYVREMKVLTLEEAVKRMTSMSMDQIGQGERGRIAEGAFADLTIFDAATIADRATYTDPHQYPAGIHHVIVNGVPIIRSGALTGATPGRVLKGPARTASEHSQETPRLTSTSPELEQRDQPVTAEDLRILTKAAELLKDESVWNRADDRQCEDDEKTGKRSLFCALQKACIDVLGKYDHRRVALQEVRFAVEDATRGQDFEHRLRDFNNLPTTRLADIKAVLEVATGRVKSRLKSQ
jgi:N-acyl-D-amino-acid deacylase